MLRTREESPAAQAGRDGPAIEARGPQVTYTTFFTPGMLASDGPGAVWPDARKLLAWLAVGLLVALRTFRWERAA
jgi:hypothetical protein